MRTLRKRHPWVLWVGGFGFLVGSLVVGSLGLASASPGPQTVTANQGLAGAQAWKVDGSGFTQPVSGTVGVNNFPSSTKIDPSGNTVTITAATTKLGSGSLSPGFEASQSTSPIDVSSAKEIRVIVQCTTTFDVCSGSSFQVSFNGAGGLGTYSGGPTINFSSGVTGATETETATYDFPGGTAVLTISNGSGPSTSFAYEVDGRSD